MTIAERERALKLVEMLKKAGENHGLLVVAGNVVIRDGVNGTDSSMMFDIRASWRTPSRWSYSNHERFLEASPGTLVRAQKPNRVRPQSHVPQPRWSVKLLPNSLEAESAANPPQGEAAHRTGGISELLSIPRRHNAYCTAGSDASW
jgi:hypothetical protein